MKQKSISEISWEKAFLQASDPILLRHKNSWRLFFGNRIAISKSTELLDWEEQLYRSKTPEFFLVGVIPYDSGRDLFLERATNVSVDFFAFSHMLEFQEQGEKNYFYRDTNDLTELEKLLTGAKEQEKSWSHTAFLERSPRAVWEKAFEKTKENIQKGEFYELNLARQLEAKFSGNPQQYFLDLFSQNPAPEAAYFSGRETHILSLSPELFLQFSGTKVWTEPIKGTRPRGKTQKEDEQYRDALLHSEKERAELLMITDLLRHDLRQSCSAVRVEILRDLQKNAFVWHSFSKIFGERKREISPIQLLLSCLPAGSISGCPKKRALEEIKILEPNSRNCFCGCLGMIDGDKEGRFSLLIRTLTLQNNLLTLQVGGGITADSNKAEEWQETEIKARSFLKMLH